MINKQLKQYIEKNIYPCYEANDDGHKIDHIKYVTDRSIKFANTIKDINYDMVYTIAAYHDIGHHIDAKNHETVSAQILLADNKLKEYFTNDEIKIMAEAVEDHRASLEGEPRSLYGKIISTADRNTIIGVQLKRTYAYRIKHNPDDSLNDIMEDARLYILKKFGKQGYATNKVYFDDVDYQKFLKDVTILTENKDEFQKAFMQVNGLTEPLNLEFNERRHKKNI